MVSGGAEFLGCLLDVLALTSLWWWVIWWSMEGVMFKWSLYVLGSLCFYDDFFGGGLNKRGCTMNIGWECVMWCFL